MAEAHEVGTDVQWIWGSGSANGTVREVFTDRVERTIDGNEIVRNATTSDPAYLIEQEDGQRVLKSHSEVECA